MTPIPTPAWLWTKDTVEALEEYMEEYHEEYGPIHAKAGVRDSGWAWVDKPWPWQNEKMTDRVEDRR